MTIKNEYGHNGDMIRFILIGTGWRAAFYSRIAKALPDRFSILGIYTRSEERALELKAKGENASTDLEALLSIEHDGVIVASGASGYTDLMLYLAERREKILTETTFLTLSEEDENKLSGLSALVLEQYWFTPLYASVRKCLPKIGRVDQVMLSALHNHHAASIIRGIFGLYDEKPEVLSFDFPSSSIKTGSRKGREFEGESEGYTRKLRVLRFPEDRLYIHDFSTNQYHTYIFPARFEIRGERGTINEKGITYVNDEGILIKEDFVFHRDSEKINQRLYLSHVTLGSEVLYLNPFRGADLDDDEIALSLMLDAFARGENPYPIDEAIKDARLGRLL